VINPAANKKHKQARLGITILLFGPASH